MRSCIALNTILFKEVRRFMRIWPQTILPPAITTALYFLIFGKLIGDRIGTINGASYMDYIVPGVVLMSVISHSYANVVSSFYSTKFQHHIEELLVAPVSNWVILAGYVGGGIVRGLVVGGGGYRHFPVICGCAFSAQCCSAQRYRTHCYAILLGRFYQRRLCR